MDNFEDEVQREDQAANEDSNFVRKIDLKFRKTFQHLRTELDKANERCIEAVANEIDDGNDDYTPLASGQVIIFFVFSSKQFFFLETKWPQNVGRKEFELGRAIGQVR